MKNIENINAYLQDELNETERTAFEAALQEDPGLQKAVDESSALLLRLQEWPDRTPSSELKSNILKAVKDERPTIAFPKELRALAAALVALLVGTIVFQLCQPSAQQPQAVNQALNWLANAQDDSGAWRPEAWGGQASYSVGLSGLSLLCFIREEDADQKVIERGTDWILSQQNGDGRFGPPVNDALYNHGIATLALLERYEQEPKPELHDALDRAIGYLVRSQHASGGWTYGDTTAITYRSLAAQTVNSGVSSWPFRALSRAVDLGFEKARPAALRSQNWLAQMTNEAQQLGYRDSGDFPEDARSLQAVGALMQSETGTLPREIQRTLRRQAEDAGPVDYYTWYHIAQALPDPGALTEIQNHVLSKRTLEGPEAGSWIPDDRWSPAGGRVYATAMATLGMQSTH